MSDTPDKSADLSKIIGVLMENPDIITKISSLVKNSDIGTSSTAPTRSTATDANEAKAEPENASTDDSARSVSVAKAPPIEPGAHDDSRGDRRSRLLFAIKPYVVPRRQAAIDTILAVTDVLDTLRRK